MTLKTPHAREQISGWIEHDGKGMPVDPRAIVSVRFRDGIESNQTSVAKIWGDGGEESNWSHSEPSEWDIVAYRLHTPASSSEDQP